MMKPMNVNMRTLPANISAKENFKNLLFISKLIDVNILLYFLRCCKIWSCLKSALACRLSHFIFIKECLLFSVMELWVTILPRKLFQKNRRHLRFIIMKVSSNSMTRLSMTMMIRSKVMMMIRPKVMMMKGKQVLK